MAIIIRGITNCSICRNILEPGQEIVAFSPFVSNELDPLWMFSDSAFHLTCFNHHPLSSIATTRYREMRMLTGPGNRVCVVCKQEIKAPDDYFTLGYLVSDPRDPLHQYNYTQAHISCLPKWTDLLRVYAMVQDLKQSDRWQGSGLDQILLPLQRASAMD